MSEKDYELLTVTYAVEAAKAFSSLKKGGEDKFVFGYLSGEGTDQREGKASQMFGRIKGSSSTLFDMQTLLLTNCPHNAGKAERILAELPSEGYPSLAVFSFRPAGIVPIRPNPEAQWWFGPAMAAVKGLGALYPPFAIKTDVLGRGMLEAVIKGRSGSVPGWPGKGLPGNEGVFRNEELKRLAAGQGSKQ